MEQTVSTASAAASVSQADPQSLRIKNAVQIQGGHYGVRGPFGIGIASGHDTGANAEATNDGRINVLLRSSGGSLKISWERFPPVSGPPLVQQTSIQVEGPTGTIETIANVGGSGEKVLQLSGEGRYSIVVRNFARAEGSGWSAREAASFDAIVHASIQSQ
jgi:hypothetical protein